MIALGIIGVVVAWIALFRIGFAVVESELMARAVVAVYAIFVIVALILAVTGCTA